MEEELTPCAVTKGGSSLSEGAIFATLEGGEFVSGICARFLLISMVRKAFSHSEIRSEAVRELKSIQRWENEERVFVLIQRSCCSCRVSMEKRQVMQRVTLCCTEMQTTFYVSQSIELLNDF